MKRYDRTLKLILIALVLGAGAQIAMAQSVNTWRGDETSSDWNDQYKWKLRHAPTGNESAHFRTPNSSILVNSTIELNNGMHLYGQELSLSGNGNINLQNSLPHQRTVNIPASAAGFANMTLNDNLSLNGRVALSAKAFGTSAGKGTITLKDRSTVTGTLCIGNAGKGSGKVLIEDNATYRITELQLATKADAGGSAEIHVLGGTARIETKENPFSIFLEDSSRKIVLGDGAILLIDYELPVSKKKGLIKAMISQNRLVAAPGCRLITPTLDTKKLTIKAEDQRNDTKVPTKTALLASIDRISTSSQQAWRSVSTQKPAGGTSAPLVQASTEKTQSTQLAGYIVFFGIALFALRRPEEEETAE